MEDADANAFPNGSCWVRADFHLHTKADREFTYQGEENAFDIADDAHVMESGRIVLSGGGKQLLDDERVQRAYLG